MLNIAHFPDICYNALMPSPIVWRLATLTFVALTLMPNVASAYMTAEEVLLNEEFFLPPTARETQNRNNRQTVTSAERRIREQQEAFEIQHPAALEEIPEEENVMEESDTETEATSTDLSGTDLELLRTLRLLDRITDRQRTLQYGATAHGDPIHGGAPPLAPTGAGAWLATSTMLGAVGWTLRRANRAGKRAWSM